MTLTDKLTRVAERLDAMGIHAAAADIHAAVTEIRRLTAENVAMRHELDELRHGDSLQDALEGRR
jgi:cell division protein FtsB